MAHYHKSIIWSYAYEFDKGSNRKIAVVASNVDGSSIFYLKFYIEWHFIQDNKITNNTYFSIMIPFQRKVGTNSTTLSFKI